MPQAGASPLLCNRKILTINTSANTSWEEYRFISKDIMDVPVDGKSYEEQNKGHAGEGIGSLDAQNVSMETPKGGVLDQGPSNNGVSGEVNMEAAITTEDVIKAGGFGAKDDLGSLLPAAIDSTDFEESLLDAQDYEEPQGEKQRPGLGWTKPKGA